jgi:hypothetical protein
MLVRIERGLLSYRVGTVGDVCERWEGTNLSYLVRAKRIATIAARIATAAYLTSRRVQRRGAFAGCSSGLAVTGSTNR